MTGESSSSTAPSGTPVLIAFTLAVILGGAIAVATRFTVAEMAGRQKFIQETTTQKKPSPGPQRSRLSA